MVKNKKNIEEKKSGRKPKGGKLISKTNVSSSNDVPNVNVILHLKCSLSDLTEYNENYNKQMTDPLLYNPSVPPDIQTYNDDENNTYFNYEETTDVSHHYAYKNDFQENKKITTNNQNTIICSQCSQCSNFNSVNCDNTNTNTPNNNISNMLDLNNTEKNNNNITSHNNVLNISQDNEINTLHNDNMNELNEMNQKLKHLKIQLFKNKINEKKSACFWCTFDFDNIECYIPSYENEDTIHGYGSFCRPECAVAYLMKESIDDSIKFERYNLINQIYGKIYNYNKNIKPAPNPYYLLDKFYGNLTIQEYRKLLKSEHLLMIVEKPLTRILPELHENMDDFSLNSSFKKPLYSSSSDSNNTNLQYKVKKNNEKKNMKTKTSIIREHFGLP
jgi:hypothetical protein